MLGSCDNGVGSAGFKPWLSFSSFMSLSLLLKFSRPRSPHETCVGEGNGWIFSSGSQVLGSVQSPLSPSAFGPGGSFEL